MSNEYLTSDNLDDLARMVTALICELWIARDRLAVVEELLEQKGVVAPGEIDGFEWSPAKAEQIEQLRDKVVGTIVGAPIAARDRSIDAILERAGLRPQPDPESESETSAEPG
jgi:hypothetical protein